MDLNDMIEMEIENGYGDANAQAKVCQDVILKAIAESSLNRNVTIKGGVVMRSKSGNVRRATQDIDIDFIKNSLNDTSIDMLVEKLNCIEGLSIKRTGGIEELKQQDYKGKRVYVEISDEKGNSIVSKLDLGVHNRLDIEQEEYCFDVAFDDEGASLLINSNEQMFTEKLKSFLRFGSLSTRYKDIYDMYYLLQDSDKETIMECFESYILNDTNMREESIEDIEQRVKNSFGDQIFLKRLETTDKRWIDENIDVITEGILNFIMDLK